MSLCLPSQCVFVCVSESECVCSTGREIKSGRVLGSSFMRPSPQTPANMQAYVITTSPHHTPPPSLYLPEKDRDACLC